MRNEFTAIVEPDGEWYIAYCPEIPGANGQGKSREECLASLREAIAFREIAIQPFLSYSSSSPALERAEGRPLKNDGPPHANPRDCSVISWTQHYPRRFLLKKSNVRCHASLAAASS